jgi:peptidoglycan L-alanyl-D-glutamate endopeptidase CwlK
MNRNYRYSSNSRANIESTSLTMNDLCDRAIKIANTRKLYCPDFGISEGKRTKARQEYLFKEGASNCDGTIHRSKHQDGLAVDYYAYIDGKADYSPGDLALIFTCFQEAASDMNIQIKWGGNFNSIADCPHIELVSGHDR